MMVYMYTEVTSDFIDTTYHNFTRRARLP